MSDWKSRAQKVDESAPAGDWRSRAQPVEPPSKADQFRAWLREKASDVSDALPDHPLDYLTPMGAAYRSVEAVPDRARAALMGVTLNTAPRILHAMGDERPLPELQQQYTQAAADHPFWNFGGALATPNPLGKAGAVARVASAGAMGGAAGYFGAPIGDVQAQQKAAGDTALLSGLLATGMEGVAPGSSKLAASLRSSAGSQAANAAGLRAGIVNQAKRAGIPMLDPQMESVLPQLGNEMLDAKLIPFAGGKVDVLRRATRLMDKSANAQQAILTRAELSGKPFDFDAAANQAESRLAEKIDPSKGGDLQTARGAGPAQSLISDIRGTDREAPGSFLAANRLKSGAYQSTNWSTEAPTAPRLKREAAGGLRESIEDQVSKALGNNEGDVLRQVNAKYGLGARTADFAEEAMGREAAHQKFGWGSLMLAATGAGAGAQLGKTGAVAGASLPILAQLGKTRGPAAAAVTLRGGSKLMDSVSRLQTKPALAAEAAAQLTTPKVGSPEARDEAARQVAQATGADPEDMEDVARKFFLGALGAGG